LSDKRLPRKFVIAVSRQTGSSRNRQLQAFIFIVIANRAYKACADRLNHFYRPLEFEHVWEHSSLQSKKQSEVVRI